MTTLIRLRRASVRFGAVEALHRVDLTIVQGERLALIGANGCGKTTLLRLLHGLLPHEGERQLCELTDAVAGARAPRVAMLFQRPFLLHLSVRRNLQLALWLARVPRPEWDARIGEALERVGLAALEQRNARALSGGQQQRLALARAWMLRPDVLLLDEPTASLDPNSKREVEALIDEFARDGMTLVMTTHNLGQAKRLASRVLYLEDGRLLVDWPAERFFTDPTLPPEAAQFLRGELPWH
ncbi:MAG TPA: phosphate ABC transporter ATP-binding protein [Burkholderiaceae bacterium]|nr:phosphate ABC transporter ATP-binding protein [Burkholderiaceae bacterium]